MLGFITIGALLMQYRSGCFKPFSISEIYQKGDVISVQLKDVGNSKREWKKMTGEIKAVHRNGTHFQIEEPIVLFVKAGSFGCESGDEILVASELIPIKNSGNPGEFDAKGYWSKKGFSFMMFVSEDQYQVVRNVEPNWIMKQLLSLREYLSDALKNNLKGNELSIAQALILGDKSLLDSETTNSFSNTGAMHVLAVSGLHIGIIMQILLVILSKFSAFISKNYAVFIVVIIAWIYAAITGLSPSVLRAVIMFSFLFVAQTRGKQYDSINTLFFTAFILLLIDPFTLFDIGFQLSFLAMVGIFLFYRPIEKLVFIENKLLRKVWQGTAIGFAAQLMTTPLSLYYFHQFPNYFILTNIGLMASSGLILGLGLFLFSISWWKMFSALVGAALSLVIFVSFYFIQWVENLPGGLAQGFEVPILLVLAMTILIVLLFQIFKKWKYKFLALCVGMTMIFYIVYIRFENMTTNEICVFNARQVIVTVKKNDQLFCFYQAKEDDFDKVKFAVDGYRKIHPGKVSFYPLSKSNWNIESNQTRISTERINGNYRISVNGRKYAILLNNYVEFDILNSFVIGMPWVQRKADHLLNNGAFVTPI